MCVSTLPSPSLSAPCIWGILQSPCRKSGAFSAGTILQRSYSEPSLLLYHSAPLKCVTPDRGKVRWSVVRLIAVLSSFPARNFYRAVWIREIGLCLSRRLAGGLTALPAQWRGNRPCQSRLHAPRPYLHQRSLDHQGGTEVHKHHRQKRSPEHRSTPYTLGSELRYIA